ncbi:MAG TPA: hypothetical protein HA283_06000 [Nanoarchaeota archaeon]|nr:hypothetical protein [Nanoarchaeota archaeon]HIH63823.1 hypothetical protein [Nanoarchaeota archaeon]HIJ09112.1 hypothetical protein [Nanoarchaeota archaeon]
MKSIDNLSKGDSIAFGFNDNGGEYNDLIVRKITDFYEEGVLVHVVLYGRKSLNLSVKTEDILAIRNDKSGTGEIKYCSGKYDIFNQEKITEIEKRRGK